VRDRNRQLGNSTVSTSFEPEEASRSLNLAEQAKNSQKSGVTHHPPAQPVGNFPQLGQSSQMA
jgi:hypothetical protein